MRWRSVIFGVIGGLAVLLCLPSVAASSAPASGPTFRVVHVSDYPANLAEEERGELLQAFATRGYVQGRNLELTTFDLAAVVAELARSTVQSLPSDPFGRNPYATFLTASIARTKPQLVLASGVRVVSGARESGLATPVVFWRTSDPVGNGFVGALARPGGNLTGFSRATEKLAAKRLELVHEMLPGAREVAFVFIEDFPSHVPQAADVKAAGARIGVSTREYGLPSARWDAVELDALFATMRRDGIDAFLLPDTNVLPSVLIELAARHRLPTIYALTGMVTDLGGLAAYSTQANSLDDVVGYAVRILRRARSG